MKYARAMLLHSTVMFMQLRNSINIPAEHAAHYIFKHFRLQERNRFRAHKRMHNSRALDWNNTEVCPTHTKKNNFYQECFRNYEVQYAHM